MQGIKNRLIRLTETDWPDRAYPALITVFVLYFGGHCIAAAIR